jgi:hypothetical protein
VNWTEIFKGKNFLASTNGQKKKKTMKKCSTFLAIKKTQIKAT